MKEIAELLNEFSITTTHIELYELAFTHSSYNADSKQKHHDYERLEFMGDSVIGVVVAELAFILHPEMNQGELSKLRSTLVQTNALANYALKYNFAPYIRLGNSFKSKIEESHPVLEDVFEAFMGAVYLDQGFKKAHKIINKVFYNDIKNFSSSQIIDFKSRLQEEMQSEFRKSVEYKLISENGPAHERVFEVSVSFDDVVLGKGKGTSKKEAEQNAAKDALSKKAGISQ